MGSTNPIPPLASTDDSYMNQLAKIYKEQKKMGFTDQKVEIYINEKTKKLKIFTDKKEAKREGFKKIKAKKVHQLIRAERGRVDPKTERTAVKALLFLPWNDPLKQKKVRQTVEEFPTIRMNLSPQKAAFLDDILNSVHEFARSDEGGNGVYYLRCDSHPAPGVTSYEQIVIKYVKNSRPVITADHILQEMRFTTPHSHYVNRSSPLGQKFIARSTENVSKVDTDQQQQLRLQAEKMNYILIMNKVGGVSLRQLSEAELIELLKNEQFVFQLGRMILIDTIMNNTDRLNNTCCNLGNILINEGKLVLLDHEVNLTPENLQAVKENLAKMLEGKLTPQILMNLQGALKHDRKLLGGVDVDPPVLEAMKTPLEAGMRAASNELVETFSSPAVINRIFQSHQEGADPLTCNLFLDLLKFIQRNKIGH